MSTEKYLTYRGDIKAVQGFGATLALTTVHPEGHATGLYRLDTLAMAIDTTPLPQGGLALAAEGERLWIAGSDGQIFEGFDRGRNPQAARRGVRQRSARPGRAGREAAGRIEWVGGDDPLHRQG